MIAESMKLCVVHSFIVSFPPKSCVDRTYILKQLINQIMAGKRQIMTRSQLEKKNSE